VLTEIDCWRNDTFGAASAPDEVITSLSQLRLYGFVTPIGDTVALTTPGQAYATVGDEIGASTGWTTAEFNVFGDGGGASANFNTGAEIQARVQTIYGGTAAPMCMAVGYTGETNNLSFATPAPSPVTPGPAMQFHENTVGGAPRPCAAASTVGDTHLTTFAGLLYDFQATGDFLLAQTRSGFEVQTRQVSGKPQWPNAAVNSAVAVRLGATRVTLCDSPDRLFVDGRLTRVLSDGSFALSSGVNIVRSGNVYLVTDAAGDSVRAVLNRYNTNVWIDVSVGLGTWPTPVHGLLANPNGNVAQLAARNGAVLPFALAFSDLYGQYGQSWRVGAATSMLADCGVATELGNPTQPFSVADLDPKARQQAQAVCNKDGVTTPGLVEACTLDVAVLGTPLAARGYTQRLLPLAVAPVPFFVHPPFPIPGSTNRVGIIHR
jgi:hypothetical protein